jgi:hypothetical protein
MSYIESTNKVLLANETYTSKTIKVDPQYLSLHISVRTDKAGTLKVYQSQYNKNFETYDDEIEVEPGTTYKQVQVKGIYLYVVYANGNEDQTDFQLVSKLSNQNISVGATIQDSLIYGKNSTSGIVTVLRTDNSGNLMVSSTGGDASSANQLLQITEAETTNTTLDVIKAENMAQTIVQEAINEKIDVRVLKCDTDNISGTIDNHNYASSDGSTWHHMASDTNGRIITLSRTHDGSGNDITSTNMTGTETWRGLDVVVKNAVYVQNATGSQLQVRKPSGTTFALYTGAISGSTLGNLDLDGYSSFDLLVYIPGGACSSPGSVYINISDNGTQWYTSSNSVYINSDSNPRYYTVSFPSLNCRYVSVTGNNPYGGSPTSTTDSTIKICAKK